MRSLSSVLSLLVVLCLQAPAVGQDLPFALDVPLPGVTGYDDAIPTPEEVIGHQIGTQHTTPAQVVDYFEAVAAASDRVRLEGHGRTYEGRPLIHAFVTSAANHARLEDIRAANVQLSEDPSAVGDDALATMPAVAYMGYSIHGNEASGTEAAVLLLYHLAAGQGPGVADVLADVVTIVDPMLNPDGRDRFADWVNRNRGAVATRDGQDREHNEPWPGGRTNHYWFDLNRDWLPLQHPESQGRVATFHRWRPQVLTDFHEMGGDATYFFQPGIPSRNNPNTPDVTFDLTGQIAEYHAEALDDIGSLYYTRESFDDFYYGKGSTYPDVNGAVGILFEQASSRALETETDFGPMTYAFTVRNQFVTSLSSLRAIAAMRESLLRHQRDFYAEAPEMAASFPVKGYVIGLDEHRTRAQLLGELLQKHRVRLYELDERVEVDGQTFEPGEAYVVPVDQQQARFIKAVMETSTTFGDSLFYDVSTWTLPLAYDVTYGELTRNPERLLGAEIPAMEPDGGRLVGGTASYAYLMPWNRYFAPRALHRFQEAGVRPVLMTESFEAIVNGQAQAFPAGTVAVPVQGRDGAVSADEVHALVQTAVAEDHVEIYATPTGLTPTGPDLGSRGATVLQQPRVALLTGSGASSYNAGEVWHLLSERFRMPVSLLDIEDVGRADLDRYDTIVMAGGYYGSLPADDLKTWISEGGRLVATTSGVDWALDQELVDLEEKAFDLDSLLVDRPYSEVRAARGAQFIGGSIFEAELDTTHPLAFGLGETIPVFRTSSTFYEPSEEPATNVGVYTKAPLMSGYLSEERAELAGGSAAVVADRYGRGRVILLIDNPNFRAFWYGSNGLFLNAVFLGGAF